MQDWLNHVGLRMPVGAELRCPYRLGSAVNLRLRTMAEARDVLGDLRERTAAPFHHKNREISMFVTVLQSRERRARNRLLLRAVEELRNNVRDSDDFRATRMKKPYDLVCWRSLSVVLCGRKRASFDADREDILFVDGWWEAKLFDISREDLDEKIRQSA